MEYKAELKNWPYQAKAAVMHGNHPFMSHCHQEMELILQKRGALEVTASDESLRLEPGELCLIPPFHSHSIGMGSEDGERLAILLDLKLMGKGMEEGGEGRWIREEIQNRQMFSRYWSPRTVMRMREIAEEIYREYTQKGYAWQLAVKTYTDELLLLAVRDIPKVQRAKRREQVSRIQDILEYIALHYCEAITLGECADHVGFNSAYFSRYFSKCMGVTFQEYIKKLRIDRAKWLLMTENISVTEICYQSGFRDVKTFNKLFKQECGTSPSGFRKENDGWL
ncbi:MAG: AraC family transcriptional regulator [Eubacteriales bacterium]|nr:AraC family transcriptional regulator [Eubacteriales bacterium]